MQAGVIDEMGDDLLKNMKSRLEEGIDRISRLSDELIHHILSHLEIQAVVKLCILSKRWRYVWKTLPFLDFTPYQLYNRSDDTFVENFLSRRNHQHDILHMKLYFDSRKTSKFVSKFITYAIQHNVQKLEVTYFFHVVAPVIKLSTFSSNSLKDLNLCMGHLYMDLSESDCWHLPALTTLHLRNCKLPTKFWDLPALLNLTLSLHSSEDNLSEVFPGLVNLRNLTLFFQKNILADFLIKCPQLVNLKISTSMTNSISSSGKIIVLAPKIRNFSSNGFFPITFGDSELENVNVKLEENSRYKDIAPSNKLKNYYRRVQEMFVGLGSARILTLDFGTIMALTAVQDVLVDSPSPFYNLKYVKIPTSYKESCISDCLKRYLLGRCPEALISTTLPQNDLIARSKVASVRAQRVVPQEPLSAPAKVLIDSGNIPRSVDMVVQEEHVVQNSVIHSEGKGSDQTKASKRDLDTYTIQGTNKTVTVGDCVLMKNSEPDKPPFVACIEKLKADGKGNIQVRVRWYYRPEEAGGGRRAFHGVKELFLSDQYDTQSAHTIEGKCTVHSFKDYTKLEDVGVEDYYSRFEYHAATRSFTPDRVAVYCKCEMPYNPDDLMIKCDECKDWYHPRCVKMTTDQAQQLSNYLCDVCSPQQDGKKPNVQNDLIACSKVDSVRAQHVAPQEPLSAPAKVLIDSGNIPRSVDMGVQEEHVAQNSVIHAEGKGSDQVISSTGNRDSGLWRGHEVNSEFVCLLDLIISKYPETFRNFTAKSKMVYAMKLNMLCTSINKFTKISLTEVTTEMIAEYRNIFVDLQDLGFNLSWLVCRLNYIEQLCLSQPLIPQLHAIDCHIGDAKNNLKDLESRVNDAKNKLEDLHTLRAEKMQEIKKAFGAMGANLAVGNIGDHLFTTNP